MQEIQHSTGRVSSNITSTSITTSLDGIGENNLITVSDLEAFYFISVLIENIRR